MKNYIFFVLALPVCSHILSSAQDYELPSYNGKTQLKITLSEQLSWSAIKYGATELLNKELFDGNANPQENTNLANYRQNTILIKSLHNDPPRNFEQVKALYRLGESKVGSRV